MQRHPFPPHKQAWPMTDATILDAFADAVQIRLAPGEALLREGERGTRLFVLAEGTLAVRRGTVRVSRVATPGALFGEMSALLDIPYSATVEAETAARVLAVEDASAFLSARPQVALHAARLLAQRLYDATTYLADLKRQFEGEAGHMGMVDRILESLLNQQRRDAAPPAPERRDPRL
jgi:CRP/FNR family transcriptional regulator, cyclic AMP receptor protein